VIDNVNEPGLAAPQTDIGGAIRAMRSRRGFSLAELGRRSGYTAAFISMLERNLRDPRLSTLERIAQGLDVSLLSLMRRASPRANRRRQGT